MCIYHVSFGVACFFSLLYSTVNLNATRKVRFTCCFLYKQERQQYLRCLQHTLNNILQQHYYTPPMLNDIADELAKAGSWNISYVHPHRTLFLGNWDVNVLSVCIEQMGKEMKWLDVREVEFKHCDFNECFALVVNIKSSSFLGHITGGRHWFAMKKFGESWYNLDSKLSMPEKVQCSDTGDVRVAGTVQALIAYLQKLVTTSDATIITIT